MLLVPVIIFFIYKHTLKNCGFRDMFVVKEMIVYQARITGSSVSIEISWKC